MIIFERERVKSKMTEKLVILDGFSLANRAFFALPPLATSDGQPTNAVYGMAMMLLRLMEELRPDYLVMAFDVSAPTFRHQEYQDYKGQRLKMEDSLRSQFPLIRQLAEILRIPIYELAGFEADDLIGTFAKQGAAHGLNVEIVTGDRDAFQLVAPTVQVLYTKRGITEVERVDLEYIQKRYQLSPQQLIDLKSLMGDASDNIPGVPGFGEKTALKYLTRFGSLEELYQHLEEIERPRERGLLEEYREQAFLSKYLATIVTNVGLELDLTNCCRHQTYDREALIAFCQEYQFGSLIKKLTGAEVTPPVKQLAELAPEIQVINELELSIACLEIKKAQKCYFQLLTTALTGKELLGLGLSNGDTYWYYPLTSGEVFLESIQEIFLDQEIVKYGHDLKTQMHLLRKYQLKIEGKIEDTLIAGYLINAGIGGLELEELTEGYLKHKIAVCTNERGSKFSPFNLPANLDEATLSKLCAGRMAAVAQLSAEFQQRIERDNFQYLYEAVELPLVTVLFEMEQTGIKVDPEYLKEFGAVLKKRELELETEIHHLVGESFNIASPKQLGVILFEKLALPAPKKNKTGYSTDAEVLEELAPKHPVIPLILEYRQNLKLQSTYIDSLIKLINPATRRVHTTFNQAVTTTGRLSSTEPNLQNIPIRSEEGRMIRKAFLPANQEYQLLAVDYSQIELRVMAHFSGDPAFCEAFHQGEDIHTATAAAVYGVPLAEVTKEMRNQAKAVNFGIIYGISGFGLAKNLRISRKEADSFIAAYFKQYPGVKDYAEKLITDARNSGQAATILGRVRKLPELDSRNYTLRSFAERMARNTPIQGTAADIIKIAMVQLQAKLREQPELGRLLLQVHDELVFESPMEKCLELAHLAKTVMEKAVVLNVPLTVEVKMGQNWGEMHPLKVVEG